MVQLFVAGLASVVIFFFFGEGTVIAPVTYKTFLAMGYIVLLNTVVAFYLQNGAQRDASPEESALIMSTESLRHLRRLFFRRRGLLSEEDFGLRLDPRGAIRVPGVARHSKNQRQTAGFYVESVESMAGLGINKRKPYSRSERSCL